jgi:hypothetical protein
MSVHCRPSTPANKHEDKTSSGSMLPWADTRPTAPDPAFLLGWAPVLPRVLYLRTPPPYRRGSGATRGSRLRTLPHYRWGLNAAACSMALGPASLLRWATELSRVSWLQTPPSYWNWLQNYHLSHGYEPCFLTGEGYGATTCLAVLYGSLDSGIKKGKLIRVVEAYKTCGQATPLWPTKRADMPLQCNISPTDHSQAQQQWRGDPTERYRAAGCMQCGSPTWWGVLHTA